MTATSLEKEEFFNARLKFISILRQLSRRLGLELSFKDPLIEKEEIKHEINASKITLDDLDTIYESLIPVSFQKRYGQFLTPKHIAQFMVSWGMRGETISILDPSTGTGVFLSESINIAINRNREIKLCGVDVDPLLLNICDLKLKSKKTQKTSINLLQGDFLKLNPSSEKFDFIICNPPYIKFHGFNRQDLIGRIEQKYKMKLSKLSNIYSLFFIHSTSFIKEGGKMAFITPSEFLYTGYGETLKGFLLSKFTIEAFVLMDLEKLVFEKALTTSVITLLRKAPPGRGHKVKLVKVDGRFDPQDFLKVLENTRQRQSRHIKKREIPQNSLNLTKKWLSYFEKNNIDENKSSLIPLGEIAGVKRGIATGCNSFFCLNQEEIEKWGIEKHFLKPIVGKAIHCWHYNFTSEDFESLKKQGEKIYLLYCFDKPSESLKRYIEYGESLKIYERFLTSKRQPWYSMEKRNPPPIFASVFSRKRMRFILNETDVLGLTPFHGVKPKFSDERLIKALLALLNSSAYKVLLEAQERRYGGGLHKLEPKDLEKLKTIDVRTLPEELIKQLATLFNELCNISRTDPEAEKKVKDKIDLLLIKELPGIKG